MTTGNIGESPPCPGALALAALVVVTQTLVELVAMVLYVRFLPLIVRVGSNRLS
jgi:hypothetical protein